MENDPPTSVKDWTDQFLKELSGTSNASTVRRLAGEVLRLRGILNKVYGERDNLQSRLDDVAFPEKPLG